jgi:hypothetical protein
MDLNDESKRLEHLINTGTNISDMSSEQNINSGQIPPEINRSELPEFQFKSSSEIILYSILTCGIYVLFLQYSWIQQINNTKSHTQFIDPGLGICLSIITCGLGGIWLNYEIAASSAAIARRTGGSSASIRKGLPSPPSSLKDIVLYGSIVSILINCLSSGILWIGSLIFTLWIIVALQRSVEYMLGIKPSHLKAG